MISKTMKSLGLVWLRRESWQWLAGSARSSENGTGAPIIRQRADFVLTPAVAARYFTKLLKIPFLSLEMVKVCTLGGWPLQHVTNRRRLPFKGHFFLHHNPRPTTSDSKHWIQKRIAMCYFSVICGHFLSVCVCVCVCVCVRARRHRRVLVWPHLRPFLRQLCRKLPVPLW